MRTDIMLPPPDDYSERDFWVKLARFALAAGRNVVEKALWLYYAAESPATPKWAKATVYGSLAYFILPVDVVPDILPVAGYTDDLAVLGAAVGAIAFHIDANVRAQAALTLERWFPA
ncbi:MAG: YkvA family protein [Gammaproteobacteria bacterium]